MFPRRAAPLALVFMLTAAAPADDPKPDPSTKVTGTVVVPKEVASFDGRVVELRLYARVAGRAADLVEKVEIKDFTHVTGKETKKEFTIGAKGERKENTKYYVTAFILKGEERTHLGQADHVKQPLNAVITDNNPRTITIRFKEIKN
ncbi:hypothetical protein [Frigoriglobus tundricola]|uniref:Uncharacterized protein n=1 Tax=Frigoriglobus tundricola TaxID=2774151 RepID=A0A6M5YN84_9BACT|nr:hypothetical protein [Frigoriglobus tundricola]QJW95569.1 hypothetical protein FTUN_3119 [Frigoriglobus tundricola]